MVDSREAKKQFWRLVWVLAIPTGIIVAISSFAYFQWMNKLDPSHSAPPLVMAIILSIFIIGLPVLGSQLSPRKTLPRNLRGLEDDFYEAIDNTILNAFGEIVFRKLYAQEMELHGFDAIETCKALLMRDETKLDDSVRLSIYVKLSRLYIKDGDADETVSYLNRAQAIRPSDIVLNLKLAEAYEWIGSAEDSLRVYDAVLTRSLELSKPLSAYIKQQIERVRTEGPREEPPAFGLRHMIY